MLDLVRYFVLVPVLPRPATSCCCSKLPAASACCLCACEVPLCPVPLVVLSLGTAHGKPATPHIPASPLWFSSCLLPALYSLVGPAVLPPPNGPRRPIGRHIPCRRHQNSAPRHSVCRCQSNYERHKARPFLFGLLVRACNSICRLYVYAQRRVSPVGAKYAVGSRHFIVPQHDTTTGVWRWLASQVGLLVRT
jgi:hypothetical protein